MSPREPIHNRVAQEFLVQFLQNFAVYQDVQDSLIAACQFLKLQKNLTLPSAYLIPSLFRHPEAPLLRLQPPSWRRWAKRFLPTTWEAATVAAVVLLSWQLPVQDWLLAKRIDTQAVYRNLTNQVSEETPPLLLVQIDDRSLIEDDIGDVDRISRRYLADLVDQAVAIDSQVVALDYLLDRTHVEDSFLASAIRNAVENNNTRLIFAGKYKQGSGWLKLHSNLDYPGEVWQGDLRLLGKNGQYLRLLPSVQGIIDEPERLLPLGYVVALAHKLNSTVPSSQNPLYLTPHLFSRRMLVSPVTTFSYKLRQRWLRPVVDFSVPPEQIYQRISAWEFLELPVSQLRQKYLQTTVMIIPGGYSEAGIDNSDNFTLPGAVRYWRDLQQPPDDRNYISGGEIHAYGFHHYLNQWLVVPIPDLWLIAVAAMAGKILVLVLQPHPQQRWRWFAGMVAATGFYGLLSWQVYVGGAVLLPWLLPTATVWFYLLPHLIRRKNHV